MASGLGYFLAIGSLIPVLPRYVETELGGGGLEVGLVVGAFAVSAGLVRPTVGRLGDRLGRRALATVGAAIAAISIAPLGLVNAVWFLIVMRLVAGLGEAGFFIGSATAAQDLAPPDRRGEAASYFSIAIYGGLAFGPVIGEYLYNNYGSGANWAFAAGGCAVGAVLAWFIPSDLGRVEDPQPAQGLLHPAAAIPGFVLLLGLLAFSGYGAFIPLYVDELGIDDAGPLFLVYGLVVMTVRILGARVPDRLGPVRAATGALSAISLGIGTIAIVGSTTGLWVGTVLLGIGMSLLYPALFTVVMENTPDGERSHAVGTFSLFFDLSQGLGAPVLGVIVTLTGAERPAFGAAAVLAVVGLYLTNTVLRRAVSTTPSATPLQGPPAPRR